jgi:phosphonate transport system substrate-binding protein
LLTFVTCQAPNSEPLYEAIAKHLSATTRIHVRYDGRSSWQERYSMLTHGEAQLGVVCGLPYVRQADAPSPAYQPLAAPVMADARYGGRPVYLSDVVVRASSPLHHFDDLEGATWAYNEPDSHSGAGVVGFELARRGLTYDYFAKVIESGAHQRTIELILEGAVDASAIDSTVLAIEVSRHPELASALRTIETWGPSPAPPIVASTALDQAVRARLRGGLTSMHQTEEGAAALSIGLVERLAPMNDADYDPIREMADLAAQAGLLPPPKVGLPGSL